jgi:NAD(P)-dependent dehydrogenase (short-subunit alcohol dehydrogenase family)
LNRFLAQTLTQKYEQAIGQGIAKRLIDAGAKVAIFDLNAKAAEETASQLGPHALAVPGDVTVEADIKKAIQIINEKWGHIDILVNNAGVVGKTAPLWELTREDYEKVLSVNLIGPFLFCKYDLDPNHQFSTPLANFFSLPRQTT